MPRFTPASRSTAAALSRVLDSVPRGYSRFTLGQVPAEKCHALAVKLHARHAIGASASQRITRKGAGRANALLVLHWPQHCCLVDWAMFFTPGELDAHEKLRDVVPDRLHWLDYELVRLPARGRTSWTWRRPHHEMAGLFALVIEQCNRRQWETVAQTLARIAAQPGFHGVREQSYRLCAEAVQRGFPRERVPALWFMQKIAHGEPLQVA